MVPINPQLIQATEVELVCEVCKQEPAAGTVTSKNAGIVTDPFRIGNRCFAEWAHPVWMVMAEVEANGGPTKLNAWFLKTITYHCGEYISVGQLLHNNEHEAHDAQNA